MSVLGLVWLLLTGDWSAVAASVQTALSSEKLWMYGIIYGLMTMPSSLLIERIFRPWMEKLPSYTGLEGAGKIIGYIERILIVTFVSTGNLSAVGFLITAKSVMRFSDIKSSSDFRMTEYILLGTMISFMIGIMGGLVLC